MTINGYFRKGDKMCREEIRCWLFDTLYRVFEIEQADIKEETLLDFTAEEQLYLYYEIWKQYGIFLSKEQIDAGAMDSPENLIGCIASY